MSNVFAGLGGCKQGDCVLDGMAVHLELLSIVTSAAHLIKASLHVGSGYGSLTGKPITSNSI